MDYILETVATFDQTVLIFGYKTQLEQVSEVPRTVWTWKEATAVVCVLYASVFSEDISFDALGCVESAQVWKHIQPYNQKTATLRTDLTKLVTSACLPRLFL